jgi:hypothetical protein
VFLFMALSVSLLQLSLDINGTGGSNIKCRYAELSKYEVLSTFEAAFQVITKHPRTQSWSGMKGIDILVT